MRLNPTNISIIKRLLMGRNSRPLRSILSRLSAADLSSLYSHLTIVEKRHFTEALLAQGLLSPVLDELPENQTAAIIHELEDIKVLELVLASPESSAAHLLSLLTDHRRENLLEQIPRPKRSKLIQYLNYPEDSAGRLMIEQVFTLNKSLSAGECIEEIRRRSSEESIYYVYCVDDDGRLEGVVSLRNLVTARATVILQTLARRDIITVDPTTPASEVANLVSRHDFVAVPVVDQQFRLIGIITVDDILDLIQDQATAQIYATAGLQEDDRVYTPFGKSLKKRLPWMLLNLVLAAAASAVVSLFEETIAQLVILATLQNIVAGTGGNTAIQTLTVMTRGLATDDFQFITFSKALLKESLVGLYMGVILGGSAGILVYFWKGSALVAVVICLAMIFNLLLASTMGAIMPVVIRKLNFDPAVSAGVLVTVCTDIFGFFCFLGIATLGLKYAPLWFPG